MTYYILLTFASLALLSFLIVIFINCFAIEQPTKDKEILKTILANDRLTIFYKDKSKSVYVKHNGWWYLQRRNIDASNPHDNFIECSVETNRYIRNIVANIELAEMEDE